MNFGRLRGELVALQANQVFAPMLRARTGRGIDKANDLPITALGSLPIEYPFAIHAVADVEQLIRLNHLIPLVGGCFRRTGIFRRVGGSLLPAVGLGAGRKFHVLDGQLLRLSVVPIVQVEAEVAARDGRKRNGIIRAEEGIR